jgi:hypothetical protein
MAEAQTLPQRNYGFDTGVFADVKGRLRTTAPSSTQRRAGTSYREDRPVLQEGSRDQFLTFRGNAFEVQYPASWTVFGGTDSASVTIAPRQGVVRAPNGGSQVGLGAIFSYFYPEGDQINIASDTRDLIHHLEQLNSTLRLAGAQRQIELDGRRGLVTMLQSDSPFGGTEQDRLLTIATSDGMFYLMLSPPRTNTEMRSRRSTG